MHVRVGDYSAELVKDVLLDGQVIDYAVEADDRAGYVKYYFKNPDGTVKLDSNKEPIIETKKGNVEIILKGFK